VCLYIPTQQAGIIELEEMIISMQRFGEHVPAATYIQNNIRILDTMFSMWSVSYQILNIEGDNFFAELLVMNRYVLLRTLYDFFMNSSTKHEC
jgi:hypothetical protein